MNGTLALWFERKNVSAANDVADDSAPSLNLHVNLWRDLDESFNFLDLGFLLSDVGTLGRLYLYLPAHIELGSIYDLSTALKDQDTLNAVFNEVSTIGPETDDSFTVNAGRPSEKLIHRVNPPRDLDVSYVTNPGRPSGTIVALNSACCERIVRSARSADAEVPQYVRLRIFLRGEARNLFTTVDAAPGVGLSLSQDFLETTEFRLNERRSYPTAILQRAASGKVRLLSVHYFLIRSRNYQLSSQHQTFRKIRNLEADIWTSYLDIGRYPTSKSRGRSRGMIIYQWRERAEPSQDSKKDKKPKPVMDDFIAYASFRVVKSRVLAYVVAAFAIGGVGSALCNIAGATFGAILVRLGWRAPGLLVTNASAALLLVGLSLVPMSWSIMRILWGRWRGEN